MHYGCEYKLHVFGGDNNISWGHMEDFNRLLKNDVPSDQKIKSCLCVQNEWSLDVDSLQMRSGEME